MMQVLSPGQAKGATACPWYAGDNYGAVVRVVDRIAIIVDTESSSGDANGQGRSAHNTSRRTPERN